MLVGERSSKLGYVGDISELHANGNIWYLLVMQICPFAVRRIPLSAKHKTTLNIGLSFFVSLSYACRRERSSKLGYAGDIFELHADGNIWYLLVMQISPFAERLIPLLDQHRWNLVCLIFFGCLTNSLR